jgi:hypothetical protein
MGFLKNGSKPPEEEAPPVEEMPDEEVEAPADEDTESQEEAAPGDVADWPGGIPPEQQDALESALTVLHTVLYKNPKTQKAVLNQLVGLEEQPASAGESVAKASVLILQQIHAKQPMQPEVLSFMVPATVSRLLELAERVKGLKLSPEDLAVAYQGAAQGVDQVLKGSQQPPAPNAPAPPTVQ